MENVGGARVRERVRGAREGLAEAAAAGDRRLLRAAIDELEDALRAARVHGVPVLGKDAGDDGGHGKEGV